MPEKKKANKISESKQKKVAEAVEIGEKLKKAVSVVLIDYRGFKVSEDTALRRAFRKENVEYKVLKNTLVRRALNDLGIKDLDDKLNGPTAVAFGYDDLVAPAKIIVDSINATKKMSVKGGLLEGKAIGVEQVKALAAIPDKKTLIAQLLAMLTAPTRKLAVALDQIAQK
ncbi:MAG: 50S ribosomal protein L10 [Clostridiales bacterium]|jgi:large subunit ribosomal protein L10|nr:50S ribosomal protein L10 [Clostridiales bacterium]